MVATLSSTWTNYLTLKKALQLKYTYRTHTNHKHRLNLSQRGHTHVITIRVKTYTNTSSLLVSSLAHLPLPTKMPPFTLHPPSSQKVTIILNWTPSLLCLILLSLHWLRLALRLLWSSYAVCEKNFRGVYYEGACEPCQHLSKVDQMHFITKEEEPESLSAPLAVLLGKPAGTPEKMPSALGNGFDLCICW